jgi:hypothetical protein
MDGCVEKFEKKTSIIKHIKKIHHGSSKIFKCTLCPTMSLFLYRQGYERHRKQKHPETTINLEKDITHPPIVAVNDKNIIIKNNVLGMENKLNTSSSGNAVDRRNEDDRSIIDDETKEDENKDHGVKNNNSHDELLHSKELLEQINKDIEKQKEEIRNTENAVLEMTRKIEEQKQRQFLLQQQHEIEEKRLKKEKNEELENKEAMKEMIIELLKEDTDKKVNKYKLFVLTDIYDLLQKNERVNTNFCLQSKQKFYNLMLCIVGNLRMSRMSPAYFLIRWRG